MVPYGDVNTFFHTASGCHTFPITARLNQPSGAIIPLPFPIVEYEYEASHPSVALTGGTSYWVEITNNTTGTCFWLWSSSPTGDGVGKQISGGIEGATDYDLAFCLDTIPAPAIPTMSQWGIIILCFIMIILGLVVVGQKKMRFAFIKK